MAAGPFDHLFDDNGNTANLGRGDDEVHAKGGNDIVRGYDGNDIIFGDAGADTLFGLNGDDNLYGGTEDDWLSGGVGRNFIDGGNGTDTADYSWFLGDNLVFVDLSKNFAQDIVAGGSENPIRGAGLTFNDTFGLATDTSGLLASIENVNGATNSANYIAGNVRDNVLNGGKKGDFIDANYGDDFVYGDDGDDIISLGYDNDSGLGGSGKDSIYGNFGTDQIYGGPGIDVLQGGPHNDRFYFQSGDGPRILRPPSSEPATTPPPDSSTLDYIADFDSGDILTLTDGRSAIYNYYTGGHVLVTAIFEDNSEISILVKQLGNWKFDPAKNVDFA